MEIKNKVVYKKLTELSLLNNNPRVISKENMDKLKKSIKNNPDYFEARPIICSDRIGKLVILAGNQRYLASKDLGLKEVPCVILHNLTEQKEKEIVIRDNVELGQWDYELLANEWEVEELQDWGVDIPSYEDVDEEELMNNTDLQELNTNQGFNLRNKKIKEYLVIVFEGNEKKEFIEKVVKNKLNIPTNINENTIVCNKDFIKCDE